MSVTDTAALSLVQLRLVEPVADGGQTWPSGLWTKDEVFGYLNQRQQRFLGDTFLLLSQATLPVTPNVVHVALPEDWMVTFDAVWRDVTGATSPLYRGDGFEADRLLGDWPTTPVTTPLTYTDSETPSATLRLAPVPLDKGVIDLLYVGLPAGFDGTVEEVFTVPDEYLFAILYGIMADMLGKVGRGQDLERAGYCESRYEEGVQVALLLLQGG